MERAKILVVDDESRMRKLVKDFLTREGYKQEMEWKQWIFFTKIKTLP